MLPVISEWSRHAFSWWPSLKFYLPALTRAFLNRILLIITLVRYFLRTVSGLLVGQGWVGNRWAPGSLCLVTGFRAGFLCRYALGEEFLGLFRGSLEKYKYPTGGCWVFRVSPLPLPLPPQSFPPFLFPPSTLPLPYKARPWIFS